MRYGSVCSGIEAVTVAWRHLGWDCAFVSEIDKFPSAVLQARLPEIKNLGDFTLIGKSDYDGDIDILVGGTPCPSFSRAGQHKGLADPRGQLAIAFAELAFRANARWVVWENVTDVLAHTCCGDFAKFISRLVGWDVPAPAGKWRKAGLVTGAPGHYSVGWRVFDARYTRVQQFPRAVPQRRRRVLLVGCLGDWRDCARVLFEGEMCGGHTPPMHRAARQTAADAGGGAQECIPLDLTNLIGRTRHLAGKGYDLPGTAAYSITKRRPSGVCTKGRVRQLTPLECERVMGFPDGWTKVPFRKKPADKCPDGVRYKALGNSMCTNVMAWIGERIDAVEKEKSNGRQEDRGAGREDACTAEGGGS